jgi:hypothetical protein
MSDNFDFILFKLKTLSDEVASLRSAISELKSEPNVEKEHVKDYEDWKNFYMKIGKKHDGKLSIDTEEYLLNEETYEKPTRMFCKWLLEEVLKYVVFHENEETYFYKVYNGMFHKDQIFQGPRSYSISRSLLQVLDEDSSFGAIYFVNMLINSVNMGNYIDMINDFYFSDKAINGFTLQKLCKPTFKNTEREEFYMKTLKLHGVNEHGMNYQDRNDYSIYVKGISKEWRCVGFESQIFESALFRTLIRLELSLETVNIEAIVKRFKEVDNGLDMFVFENTHLSFCFREAEIHRQ